MGTTQADVHQLVNALEVHLRQIGVNTDGHGLYTQLVGDEVADPLDVMAIA
jgi:hypothetical protein